MTTTKTRYTEPCGCVFEIEYTQIVLSVEGQPPVENLSGFVKKCGEHADKTDSALYADIRKRWQKNILDGMLSSVAEEVSGDV